MYRERLSVGYYRYCFLIIASILLCVSSVSCTFFGDSEDSPIDEGVKQSNFIVNEVEGNVLETSINGLPEEIQISYKACFRDFKLPDQVLQNTLFQVLLFENFQADELSESDTSSEAKCSNSSTFLFNEDAANSCLEIRTDSSGCLNWTEVYPYKMINESVWFKYKRVMKGTGIYQGNEYIDMAMAPWLALDPSGSAIRIQLVDLRYHKIKGKLVELKDDDIDECSLCNKNDEHCSLCEFKKGSLSHVMDHFYKQSERPGLWLSHINSNINQEYINIRTPTPQNLAMLKRFNVCISDTDRNCDSPGRFFKIQLEMPLTIRVKNYRGEYEHLLLRRGEYSIEPILFLKEGDQNWVLHRKLEAVSSSLVPGSEKGNLKTTFYLHVPNENYGMEAFLALRVKPRGNIEFLPFEGVFSFSSFLPEVMGARQLTLSDEVEDFYNRPKNKEKSFIQQLALKRDMEFEEDSGFRKAGWDIQLRRLRFSDVITEEGKCPTPIGRHIRYVGEVCIVDPINRKPVSSAKIKIKRIDISFDENESSHNGESMDLTDTYRTGIVTDLKEGKDEAETHGGDSTEGFDEEKWSGSDGCLQWVDELEHKWYDREHYFVRKMIFEEENTGFKGEKIIAINPWHFGFVFFQDISLLGVDSIRTKSGVKAIEKPKLVFHDFRSLFVEPIYTIDRWLGIHLFQNLLFLFRVRVDRPDNVAVSLGGQRPSAADLRRGYYLLRFILLKSHTEEDGGAGNMVVRHEDYMAAYHDNNASLSTPLSETEKSDTFLDLNDVNTGWALGRTGKSDRIGQFMNTSPDYITYFDTVVFVRDGSVNAYINFQYDMDSFIFIGSNARIIVELLPTDPQYYKYEQGTCKVDANRSEFKAFTNHELISQPFIGSFVPKDLRNWNIFRPLDVKEYAKVKGYSINTDELINQSTSLKNKNPELFRAIQNSININVVEWGDSSREEAIYIGADLQSVYDSMESIIEALADREGSVVSSTRRNQLSEFIYRVSRKLNIILSRGALEGTFKGKLSNINQYLNNLRDEQLQSPALSLENMKTIANNFLRLAEDLLPGNMQAVVKSTAVSVENSPSSSLTDRVDEESRLGVCRSADKDSSTARACEFAENEGLKNIFMDGKDKERFLEDLKEMSERYKQYRQKYIKGHVEKSDDSDVFEDVVNSEEMEHRPVNQFTLFNDDHETHFIEKNEGMTLSKVSEDDLYKIILNGIHGGSINTSEVSVFLHLMCGFWFDKFYDEYLEERQLKTIFDKHNDHFNYYNALGASLLREYQSFQLDQYWSAIMSHYHLQEMMGWPLLEPKTPFIHPSESVDGVVEFVYSSVGRNSGILAMMSLPGLLGLDNIYSYRHPYMKCLNNPLNFFHIEKKIIVGDIGSEYSDLEYSGGHFRRFSMQGSFDFSYALNWSMSRSFSTSIGTGFTGLNVLGSSADAYKLLSPLHYVSPFFVYNGLRFSTDWSSSASDSESSRRQQTLRFAQPLDLMISHTAISIRPTDFRHCLVIRPQNMAFQDYLERNGVWKPALKDSSVHQIPYIKSGLLLCSETMDLDTDGNPFKIPEDYFYIYQPVQGDQGEIQRQMNARNRPYVITVRGITELEKLMFLMQAFSEADEIPGNEDYDPLQPMTNPYYRKSDVFEGVKKAFYQAKVWDKSGFYPGVYNVRYSSDHFYYRIPTNGKEPKGLFKEVMKWAYENNPIGYIPIANEEAVLGK